VSHLRYNPKYKRLVVEALHRMLETLRIAAAESEAVYKESEEYEASAALEEGKNPAVELAGLRDMDNATIARIMQRTEQVRTIKEAFESADRPPKELLDKIHSAIVDCISYSAIELMEASVSFLEEVWPSGRVPDFANLRPEQVRAAVALSAYTAALNTAFSESVFAWDRFPFDGMHVTNPD
jgi:hypothetical protein